MTLKRPVETAMTRRRLLLQAMTTSLASAAISFPIGGLAQSFTPARPVRLVIPQPAGGAADRLARLIAESLGARWKQPVIVDYKPGGGVVVGTLATARSTPDGLTLGLLGSSLSINAVQRTDLPYDTFRDLTPLVRVGYYTVGLFATASFPANDMKGLITLAKSNPGKFSFGSNGIGTSAQLAGEMLNHMAGVEIQHIPYNGAGKMITDMVGGQIPLGFSVASTAENFVKSGQLKMLGVTSQQRSPLYPTWPAISETLPGFEAVNWAGFLAPAGLTDDLVARISADIAFVLQTPEISKAIAYMGIELAPQGPAEFETFIRDEVTRFSAVTKPLGRRMQ